MDLVLVRLTAVIVLGLPTNSRHNRNSSYQVPDYSTSSLQFDVCNSGHVEFICGTQCSNAYMQFAKSHASYLVILYFLLRGPWLGNLGWSSHESALSRDQARKALLLRFERARLGTILRSTTTLISLFGRGPAGLSRFSVHEARLLSNEVPVGLKRSAKCYSPTHQYWLTFPPFS